MRRRVAHACRFGQSSGGSRTMAAVELESIDQDFALDRPRRKLPAWGDQMEMHAGSEGKPEQYSESRLRLRPPQPLRLSVKTVMIDRELPNPPRCQRSLQRLILSPGASSELGVAEEVNESCCLRYTGGQRSGCSWTDPCRRTSSCSASTSSWARQRRKKERRGDLLVGGTGRTGIAARRRCLQVFT